MPVRELQGISRIPSLYREPSIVRRKPVANYIECVQLAGAEHPRMAGGDLLDEARTRARHSDDEDRRLRRVAPRGGGRKEVGCGEFDQIIHLSSQPVDIEVFAGFRALLPMKSIGLGKAGEGLVAAFGIVQ